MNKGTSAILVKIILLILAGFFLVRTAVKEVITYHHGDGPEYVAMLEAFYNNFTPDIRSIDLIKYKEEVSKFQDWTAHDKNVVYDSLISFTSRPKAPLDKQFGIYASLDNKFYSYHFWIYSFVNLPARAAVDVLKIDPQKTFQITNIFLILITCAIILFVTPFNMVISILISALFVYTSSLWYVSWPHPEIFTACLVFIGLWLYFQDKFYVALACITLASMQNQPLALVVAFLACITVYKRGLTFKNIAITGLVSVWCLLPGIFYYMHFHIANLIKHDGYLDTKCITFTRVFGFFFDLNQGMIYALPLILFAYLFVYFWHLYRVVKREQQADVNLLWPLIIITIVIVVSSMQNWNHGQAVLNRYAVWISNILLVHFLFLVNWKSKMASVFLGVCLVSQYLTINAFDGMKAIEWDWNQHKPLAKMVLTKMPALYNPDPSIFGGRTISTPHPTTLDSPVLFYSDSGDICKAMVHQAALNELDIPGIKPEQLTALKKNMRFINGWAYINKGQIETTLSPKEKVEIRRKQRIKQMVDKIKSEPEWYKAIEKKASELKIPVDSMLLMDAAYVIDTQK